MKALIEAGVDVNKADTDNRTPLFNAAWMGHEAVVKALIEAGADVNKANAEHRRTPLFQAILLGHEAVVKALIEAGADVNKANTDDWTPLYTAAWKGREALVKALIEAGADVDKADTDHRTPLYTAAWYGHEAVMKALIEAGADVNKADEVGRTPLYMAAQNGHEAVVKTLIEAGADVNKADVCGTTPLNTADANGHGAVVRVLLPYTLAITEAITERTRLKRRSRRIQLCCRLSFIPLLYVLQIVVLNIIIYGDTCGGDRGEFLNDVQFNGSHIIHEDCTEDMENDYICERYEYFPNLRTCRFAKYHLMMAYFILGILAFFMCWPGINICILNICTLGSFLGPEEN